MYNNIVYNALCVYLILTYYWETSVTKIEFFAYILFLRLKM